MNKQLPNTYRPDPAIDPASRPRHFDPALKHFRGAYRLGDPAFDRPGEAAAWRRARRLATGHVLRSVVESPWADRLVLRGSLVLKAWFGDAAREPGDMDWVVAPADVKPADPWATAMFADLPRRVAARPCGRGVEVLADRVASDDIWTYDRAPGRRLVFPWRAGGLSPGVVQLDFVFGERPADAPVETPVPVADGGTVTAWTATMEQSLAWKVLWLETDGHPQGKDLYDAVLLAEQADLSPALLRQTFDAAGAADRLPFAADRPLTWYVEWDHFLAEYPDVKGPAGEWQARLARALKRSFAEAGDE